jgi:hypothetical protein
MCNILLHIEGGGQVRLIAAAVTGPGSGAIRGRPGLSPRDRAPPGAPVRGGGLPSTSVSDTVATGGTVQV